MSRTSGARAAVSAARPAFTTWIGLLLLASGCWPAYQQVPAHSRMTMSDTIVPMGILQITITWPMGPGRDLRGYQAQLIPDSSSRVDVTITNSASQVVGTGSVTRQAGEGSKTLAVEVAYSNNLSLKAEAFPTSNGPSGNTGPIARGSTAGINVNANLVATGVTMGSLYTPAIETLSVNAGPAGQTVTITGTNLAPDWATTPAIAFNGTAAGLVTRNSATSVTAGVPGLATVGQVTSVTDGVASTGTANFWVVSGIAMAIADHTLLGQSLTGSSPYVGYGGTLATTATTTFNLGAGKTLADYPAPPVVSFSTTTPGGSCTGTAAAQTVGSATTAKDGTFTAPADHQTGQIRASFGDAVGGAPVEAIGIDSVSVTPITGALNVVKPAAQAGLADMPGVTTSRVFTATVAHSIPAGFPAAPGVGWATAGIGGKLVLSGSQTDTPSNGSVSSQIAVTTDETAQVGGDGQVTATAKVGSFMTPSSAQAAVTTTVSGQISATVQ